MLKEIIKVAEQRYFFNIVKRNERVVKYKLNHSGLCMKQNIINEWLRSIYMKSHENSRILINEECEQSKFQRVNILDIPEINSKLTGLVEISQINDIKESDSSENMENYFHPYRATEMKLSVSVERSEAMQRFLQWQRYRKIWWSSITTSPGLFHLKDMCYTEHGAEVEILAHLPWGQQPVEKLSMDEHQAGTESNKARLDSALTVECALLTLLADGYSNKTQEEYLRLHRTIAPYKISFAIDSTDFDARATLEQLAEHLNYQLNANGISAWYPADFNAPLEQQLVEKYRLGVPYTIVLTADSLSTGILQLLHSSTTLKEQIHITDFGDYALKLLKSCFAS